MGTPEPSSGNPLVLVPLSLEKALTRTIEFTTKHFSFLFLVVAIIHFPLALITNFFFYSPSVVGKIDGFVNELNTLIQTNTLTETNFSSLLSSSGIPSIVGYVSGWSTVQMLIILLATIALYQAIVWLAEGKQTSLGEVYAKAASKYLSFFFTKLVLGILIFIGFLAIIVPGVYLALIWSFVPWIILTEDKAFFSAASRSQELTKGRLLTIIGYGIVFFFIIAVLNSIIGLITGYLPIHPILEAIISTALEVFTIAGVVFGGILFFSIKAEKQLPAG